MRKQETKISIKTFSQLFLSTTILLSILTLASTQNASNNTTQSTACNSGKPLDYSECYSRPASNSYSRCCYLENFSDQNKKMCLEIPAVSFTGAPLYTYNNVLYKINCPNVTAKDSLSLCSNIVSTGKADCSMYSTYTESCCFHEEDKKCYWLGAKFEGRTLWGGKNLDCAAGFLKENIVKFLLIALSVLIL